MIYIIENIDEGDISKSDKQRTDDEQMIKTSVVPHVRAHAFLLNLFNLIYGHGADSSFIHTVVTTL